jgi:hypothetical protein
MLRSLQVRHYGLTTESVLSVSLLLLSSYIVFASVASTPQAGWVGLKASPRMSTSHTSENNFLVSYIEDTIINKVNSSFTVETTLSRGESLMFLVT